MPIFPKRVSRSYPILGDDSDIAATSRAKTMKIPSAITERVRRELIEHHALALSAVVEEMAHQCDSQPEVDPPPAVMMPEIVGFGRRTPKVPVSEPLVEVPVPLPICIATAEVVEQPWPAVEEEQVRTELLQATSTPEFSHVDVETGIAAKLGVTGTVTEVFASAQDPYSARYVPPPEERRPKPLSITPLDSVVRAALFGIFTGAGCGLAMFSSPVPIPQIATKNDPRMIPVVTKNSAAAEKVVENLQESLDEHVIKLVNKLHQRIQTYEQMITEMDERIVSLEREVSEHRAEKCQGGTVANKKEATVSKKKK